MILRPYQKENVEAIWKHVEAGTDTLYVLPTGGGKTTSFTSLTNAWTGRRKRVWILVHRRELLSQASADLQKLGVEHGRVAPGRMMTPDLVQVASVDTILSRLAELAPHLERVDRVIVDEAHHAVAGKWDTVRRAMRNATCLGVTATPYRTDGQGLGTAFRTAVVGPSVADLTSMGYLTPATVYAPPQKADLSQVRKRGKDFNVNDLAAVMDKPEVTLAAIEHYRKLCDGAPAVVFCPTVEHARHVAEQFSAAGYRSAAVDGNTPEGERDGAIKGLGNGRVQILASCDIISEGTDIPVVTAAILMRLTDSTGLYQQQVGRVLRAAKGKDRAIIIDEVGNVARHGMHDAVRPWTLAGGIKAMERSVEATWRCRSCWTRSAAESACPTCSKARPATRRVVLPAKEPATLIKGPAQAVMPLPQFSDAQLLVMTLPQVKKIARTEAELKRVADVRGYKAGWVSHVMAERSAAGRYRGYRRYA